MYLNWLPEPVSPLSLQVMTPGLYRYYVTELAFYWSLMFSQFTDIKRKVRGTTFLSNTVSLRLDYTGYTLAVKHFLMYLFGSHLAVAENVCVSMCDAIFFLNVCA